MTCIIYLLARSLAQLLSSKMKKAKKRAGGSASSSTRSRARQRRPNDDSPAIPGRDRTSESAAAAGGGANADADPDALLGTASPANSGPGKSQESCAGGVFCLQHYVSCQYVQTSEYCHFVTCTEPSLLFSFGLIFIIGPRKSRRIRQKNDPNSWASPIITKRTNVLCLGVSRPFVPDLLSLKNIKSHQLSHSTSGIDQTAELIARNVITAEEGMHLVRCLALERTNDTLAYT